MCRMYLPRFYTTHREAVLHDCTFCFYIVSMGDQSHDTSAGIVTRLLADRSRNHGSVRARVGEMFLPSPKNPTPSSAEVKERVELYLYSPCGPSRPVAGRTLPLLPSPKS